MNKTLLLGILVTACTSIQSHAASFKVDYEFYSWKADVWSLGMKETTSWNSENDSDRPTFNSSIPVTSIAYKDVKKDLQFINGFRPTKLNGDGSVQLQLFSQVTTVTDVNTKPEEITSSVYQSNLVIGLWNEITYSSNTHKGKLRIRIY